MADYASSALRRVARGNLCSGCGGCAAVSAGKVRMEMKAPGFLRPVQKAALPADVEDTIAQICPGLGQSVSSDGRQDSALWGPYLQMFTGHAVDQNLRFLASSGGALSGLLVHLVETKKIEGVVQVAAGPFPGTAPVANVTTVSKGVADIHKAAGSRYAPSAPLSQVEAILDAGKGQYAFVGKPCDVAAMRALEGRDPRVKERFPYLLSFFCAGVPSENAAESLLRALGTIPEEVTAFRYRGMGWPGRATATLKDGSERSMTYMESWGSVLSREVQHRCKICADGTGTAADIVCADAWESDEAGYPLFEETDGTSLIVARTQKGQDLLAAAQNSGHVKASPFDPAAVTPIQPGQVRRRRALVARLAALKIAGRPIPRYKGLLLRQAARQNDLKVNLKNFAGMLRRALQGRI